MILHHVFLCMSRQLTKLFSRDLLSGLVIYTLVYSGFMMAFRSPLPYWTHTDIRLELTEKCA